MIIGKYRVFNITLKNFEYLYTSNIFSIGQYINLPKGELQIIELISEF